ncbi:MAG: SCP2 sterol-binding domain-containing protein [Clostridia bacterium]|nr:SCP2 sterol-binding domain-containing protein [Clostridia bacterium]
MADLREEIRRVYGLAEEEEPLPALMEAICGALSRHGDELCGVTYRYRLHATDTGYEKAFGLRDGVFERLDEQNAVDVTVSGREAHLVQLLRRKMSPLMALALGRVKVRGDRAALLKLGEFLDDG